MGHILDIFPKWLRSIAEIPYEKGPLPSASQSVFCWSRRANIVWRSSAVARELHTAGAYGDVQHLVGGAPLMSSAKALKHRKSGRGVRSSGSAEYTFCVCNKISTNRIIIFFTPCFSTPLNK